MDLDGDNRAALLFGKKGGLLEWRAALPPAVNILADREYYPGSVDRNLE